jgi:large subunit ribosomal protein L24
MKFTKGDEVKVIAGKDKGKVGKIEKVFPKLNSVLVGGVNLYKRHIKKQAQKEKSEIITISKPLPVGNVILVCPNCRKATRIGYKLDEKGKVRICKRCNKKI